jgi:penicillin-binding protein 1A
MRAAIANKPTEAFAAAGAPQKKLDVPLSSPADLAKPRQPVTKPDEVDPDAPETGGDEKQPAPASATPPSVPQAAPSPASAAPIDKPVVPRAAAPAKPLGSPAKAPTEPAKPVEDERSGIAKPPDTD